MKVTAILPMRAGSQRVKSKNERIINGKCLFEYAIETLLSAERVGTILINTDIVSVKNKYSNNHSIRLIERSDHLTGNCNINNVIAETLNYSNEELYIQVHATNPLLKPETLDSAINIYLENQKNHDSLFGVTRVQKRFWSKNCVPINHNIGDEPTTQNLEPLYEENSCFYIFTKKTFLKTKNRIGINPMVFEISKLESWDIDDEEDICIVSALSKYIKNDQI